MKFILIIFMIFVITKFSGSVRQRWSLPSCGAIAEYESNTFQLERICRDDTLDHTYNFILYLAKGDSCQWTNIARQNHSVCETREKSAQRQARVVFKHVDGGYYCLAIYQGVWSSSLPVCNSEVPFYLESERKEADVQLWNPKLNVQQYGSNDLSIHFSINKSDGFNFQNFVVDLFNVDEDVANCDQIFPAHSLTSFATNFSSQILTVGNLSDGFYCVKVTPIDPRCQFSHSVTYLPCTRSSNTTHIILKSSTDIHWIFIVGLAAFLLIALVRLLSLFKKRRSNIKNATQNNMITSIFLLHSNDARLTNNIKLFKETLFKKMPSCKIDDYADEDRWESVAIEGVSWFLSRLNQEGKYVIVIEPILEDFQSANPTVEETNFFIGLQELQSVASKPIYKQVLIVWFQKSSESNESLWFENSFSHFQLPRDWDLLEQRLKNLSNSRVV